MGNTEQTILMAEIRQIKKHDEEQDKKIANLELRENINGATILKAISDLTKETRENYKSLNRRVDGLETKIQELDNKLETKIQELDNKLETKIQELDNKLETKIQELDNKLDKKIQKLDEKLDKNVQKIDSKLDVIFELLSKRS